MKSKRNAHNTEQKKVFNAVLKKKGFDLYEKKGISCRSIEKPLKYRPDKSH